LGGYSLSRRRLDSTDSGELPDWKDAQDKVDREMQRLVKLLQSESTADKAGNPEAFAASIRSQRVMAETLSALVQLMKAQS